MAKDSKKNGSELKYERVLISSLPNGRRGKHHDLIQGILQELQSLPANSAMKIPLSDVGGVSLANLRSAVHRATADADVQVETASDEQNFYIWKPGE